MADIPASIEVTKLEKLEFGLMKALSKHCIDQFTDVHIYEFCEMAAAEFRAALWGERLPSSYVLCPDTWVDAFKERWFPAWLMKMFPMRTRRIEVVTYLVHPDIKLPKGANPCAYTLKGYPPNRPEEQ